MINSSHHVAEIKSHLSDNVVIQKLIYIPFLFIVAAYFLLYNMNDDSTWLIYSTIKMLHGSKLYSDIVEVNPPLIFIINLIPAYVSDAFNLQPTYTYAAFVFVLIIISVELSILIVKKSNIFTIKKLLLFKTLIIFTLTVVPSGDFAQREHIFVILILPYFMLMLLRDKVVVTKQHLFIILLLASFGFNLKPYFFLTFFFIEFGYFLYTKDIKRALRLETIFILLSGVFYLIVVYIFFEEYINFLIPMAIKSYITFLEKPFVVLLGNHVDLFFIVMLYLYTSTFIKNKNGLDFFVVLSTVFSTIIIYFLQKKGWHYHILPALLLSLISFFYIFLIYFKKKEYILITMLFSLLGLIIKFNMYENHFPVISSILRALPSGSKVVVLSVDISIGLPLVVRNSHQWASRFPSLWMLPRDNKGKYSHELKKYILLSIEEDLKKYKPDYIIIPNWQNEYLVKRAYNLQKILLSLYKKRNNNNYVVFSLVSSNNKNTIQTRDCHTPHS